MKCLIIDGTGREGGLCDHLSGIISECIRDDDGSCEHVAYHNVRPEMCTGCGACRGGECRILDGFTMALDVFDRYDLVVFVSPIRFSGLSSQMKVFVDRMNPMWYHHENVHAKSCAILVGGSKNPKFSNAESELKALSKGCGMEFQDVLELSGSDVAVEGAYDAQVLSFLEGIRARM